MNLLSIGDVTKQDLRDAARMAIQSAIAAAVVFLLMTSLGMPEQFVGILSGVLVVQPSVGGAIQAGWRRLIASIVGAGIGALTLLLIPIGYGTAIALAGCMIVVNFVAGLRHEWRYGVVSAVALALGSDEALWATALDRTLAIGLGIGVGFAVAMLVWPEKASTRATRHANDALRALADYMDTLVLSLESRIEPATAQQRKNYRRVIQRARDSAANVRIADNSTLEDRIDAVDALFHAMLILDRVTGESDAQDIELDALESELKTVRSCTQSIVEALAENSGTVDVDEQLEQVREAIVAIRESASTTNGDHERLMNALAFALNEVEDSLSHLVDGQNGDSSSS